MKIKADFVTNSSSTSFTFVFKGSDKFDLYKLMLKHAESFDLENEYWGDGNGRIDVWDVIRAMDGVIRNDDRDMWILPGMLSIDSHLINLRSQLDGTKEYLKKAESEEGGIKLNDWMIEAKVDEEKRVKQFEELVNKGFKTIFQIGFGDNHGEIQGGLIGTTMDYAGREININKDDFVIFTEQDR